MPERGTPWEPGGFTGGVARTIRARRSEIMAAIHAHGECSVADLARSCGASEATIRRDLVALERLGMVDRSWGRARPHVALHYRDGFVRRAAVGAAAKHAVALAASALVEPNMVVGLSGGTTCTALARMLRGRPINVITNAVNVAAELYGTRPTKVILSGGALKANGYELVGAAADAIIRGYHLDVFFCSSSGVTEAGFGRRDHAEAAVVRTFRSVSERTVMLLERGKLGRHNPARVACLHEVHDVIVDGPLEPAWRERFAASGARVHAVGVIERTVPDAAGNLVGG